MKRWGKKKSKQLHLKKRKVPRDPSNDYHISNLQEIVEAHALPVHLHARSQCTAISRKLVPKYLRLLCTGSSEVRTVTNIITLQRKGKKLLSSNRSLIVFMCVCK